jgi:hypothetical protein
MKEFVIPAKAGIQRAGILIVFEILMMIAMISVADALIIESPTEGQTVVVGKPFEWKVRPSPGETCDTAISFPPFNQTTGRYEWKETLPGDANLGRSVFSVNGKPDDTCGIARVTVIVILPPTTVLQGIEVERHNLFLTKVPAGTHGAHFYETEQLRIKGQYSDGITREVSSLSMGTTYTSSDEKVATVDGEGLVTAHALGTARITIKNGEHELTVEAIVKEKKEKP